jgi:hypothetical protein
MSCDPQITIEKSANDLALQLHRIMAILECLSDCNGIYGAGNFGSVARQCKQPVSEFADIALVITMPCREQVIHHE